MPKPRHESIETSFEKPNMGESPAVLAKRFEKPNMGESPAVLAKRNFVKPNLWCPIQDIEFDSCCDADNPKVVTYKDIVKAYSKIRKEIQKTPLVRSKCCVELDIELNYKYEIFHLTGSYHERAALYSLKMLSDEKRKGGVITASTGNWAMALAHHGNRLHIPVMVVLPTQTLPSVVEKCKDFNATVILFGTNLAEAKRKAFVLISEGASCTYINGYDHPDVIAGAGSIGIEILEQLPQTQAILVPVGGGALIAGVAAAVKQLKPGVLVYGVQSDKCCCFFKAMENERPFRTSVERCLAESLAVPTAGCNSFHTARSLIDKLVLVDDDRIARAILHLMEEEKLIAEGAGASALGALLTAPDILPELRGKTVVCVVTGGNIDSVILPRCLERAKAIEGRIIKFTVSLPIDDLHVWLRILKVIANSGCNLLKFYKDEAWLSEDYFDTIFLTLICETRNLAHSCKLKHILERLFPNKCEFLEEPFSPIKTCICLPKKIDFF